MQVTDKQGHDIQGLAADDFTVTEDGRKQKIAFFDREKEPISLSIVLDHGLSGQRHTKNLPGRKSDVQESQWLLKLHTYGLLNNFFQPPSEMADV